MNAEELVGQFRQYCRQNADPSIVAKYSRYFKGGYDAYGLGTGVFKEGVKKFTDDPGLTLGIVLDAAPTLLKSPKYEETSLAIVLLLHFKKQFNRDLFHELESWFDHGINNWAHADYFAGDVMKVFHKKKIISLEDLKPWIVAKNKFQRRVVPVSLIKTLKESPDIMTLISFIEPLMTDTEREVHQGVGWFLREAWKVHRNEVEDFLLKWKNSAPRLIFQYATEKMTGEEKLRFRKEK
jgi:3-methyladenine DNA glycosylase AlkD